jgi:hypothetical protein
MQVIKFFKEKYTILCVLLKTREIFIHFGKLDCNLLHLYLFIILIYLFMKLTFLGSNNNNNNATKSGNAKRDGNSSWF